MAIVACMFFSLPHGRGSDIGFRLLDVSSFRILCQRNRVDVEDDGIGLGAQGVVLL